MRCATSLLLCLLGTGLACDIAHAHGGAYRGANGAVPPGLREPSDPMPPPPVRGRGSLPFAPDPRVPPPPTPRFFGFEDWTFWYQNNRDVLEKLKKGIYMPYSRFGRVEDFSRDHKMFDVVTVPMRHQVRTEIVPAFLRLISAKAVHPDLRAAALIGLGKLAWLPLHVAVLEAFLDPTVRRHPIEFEAAALGLGLLRRAHPTIVSLSRRWIARARISCARSPTRPTRCGRGASRPWLSGSSAISPPRRPGERQTRSSAISKDACLPGLRGCAPDGRVPHATGHGHGQGPRVAHQGALRSSRRAPGTTAGACVCRLGPGSPGDPRRARLPAHGSNFSSPRCTDAPGRSSLRWGSSPATRTPPPGSRSLSCSGA